MGCIGKKKKKRIIEKLLNLKLGSNWSSQQILHQSHFNINTTEMNSFGCACMYIGVHVFDKKNSKDKE